MPHPRPGRRPGSAGSAGSSRRSAPTPGHAAPSRPHLPRMALGWMASDTGGYDTRSHGGTMLFFYSWLWMIPERNIGVFVSTNSVGRDAAGSALRAQVWERFV
ncbi:serine hydrolase, partial [Paraburkholderia sp. EG304]|uniref:serine hydrolase n=1 Tax=Paraburkholderia sp. EG304 TaxID=3237015 RepID=UPI00397E66BF